MSQIITDAQGLNFLRQQTRVQSARAFNVEYDIVDYASLVPVNTDYPEWASGADFQVGDMAGAAKWQSGWAEDVPKADVSLMSIGVDFAMYAVGIDRYKWRIVNNVVLDVKSSRWLYARLLSQKIKALRVCDNLTHNNCSYFTAVAAVGDLLGVADMGTVFVLAGEDVTEGAKPFYDPATRKFHGASATDRLPLDGCEFDEAAAEGSAVGLRIRLVPGSAAVTAAE